MGYSIVTAVPTACCTNTRGARTCTQPQVSEAAASAAEAVTAAVGSAYGLLSLSCFVAAVQAQLVQFNLAALQLLFQLHIRLGGWLSGAALDRSA